MARLRLPEALRTELKAPLGPIYTDVDVLLTALESPVVTVGDIVTETLERAGFTPEIAIVDGRSEREPIDDETAVTPDSADVIVENPAGTITTELVGAIRASLDDQDSVRIWVNGEEDLATLPAIVLLPTGASVVYGQPDEGMVHLQVTDELKARVEDLLEAMDGDKTAVFGSDA